MKVLLINGSPRVKGCTYTALAEAAAALEEENIQWEIVHIGANPIQDCVACGQCRKLGTLENPTLDNPTQEKPTLENPTQLNKDIQSKDPRITDPSITHSFPSLSPPPAGTVGAAASPPERKGTGAATQSAVEIYRDIIKENIEYDHLLHHSQIDREELDGIVELLVETVCTARKSIRVAGDDYPAELVKAKLLKLNSGHIEFVMDCMRENTTKIRNIKKYLLAVLFNAPSTMGSYYTALVAHDMAEGKI